MLPLGGTKKILCLMTMLAVFPVPTLACQSDTNDRPDPYPRPDKSNNFTVGSKFVPKGLKIDNRRVTRVITYPEGVYHWPLAARRYAYYGLGCAITCHHVIHAECRVQDEKGNWWLAMREKKRQGDRLSYVPAEHIDPEKQ